MYYHLILDMLKIFSICKLNFWKLSILVRYLLFEFYSTKVRVLSVVLWKSSTWLWAMSHCALALIAGIYWWSYQAQHLRAVTKDPWVRLRAWICTLSQIEQHKFYVSLDEALAICESQEIFMDYAFVFVVGLVVFMPLVAMYSLCEWLMLRPPDTRWCCQSQV